jgi:hypothetical protein
MPRGLPDYGIPQYAQATTSIDLATLFLAQTGIASVDGKGRILYADNFHAGLAGFMLYKEGNASLAYPSSTNCYIPPLSAGFNPGTYSGAGISWLYKWITLPDTERVGIEAIFGIINGNNLMYSLMLDYGYSDNSEYNYTLRWYTDTGKVSITVNEKEVQIGSYEISVNGPVYIPVKLVGNISTGKYDHVLVGNKGYNLTSYNANIRALTAPGVVLASIGGGGVQSSTVGDYGRIGYMILTVDEP